MYLYTKSIYFQGASFSDERINSFCFFSPCGYNHCCCAFTLMLHRDVLFFLCLFQVTAALVSVLSIFCSCLQSKKVGLLSSDLLWLVPARPQICLSEKVVGISLLFLSNHSGISLSHINVSDKLQAGDGQKTVFPCCKIISDFKNCPILFWDKYFSRYCMFTDRLRELEVVWGMAHVCRLYHPYLGQEFGQSSARPTRQL